MRASGAPAGTPRSRRRRAGLDATHDALQPGAQLARVERLRDVVVGAHLEADDAVHDLARAGHHDDPEVVALAQVPREREAVLARQADVEQHHLGHAALELGAHRGAAVGLDDLVAVRGQVLDEHVAHGAVVVDDQHLARIHFACAHPQ